MPLMTQDEYARLKHKVPYVYKIKNDNQFLYYFGEKHSYDPKDKQWIEVRNLWDEFIKETKNTKRVVFYEGGRTGKWDNEIEAITNAGGTGFITYNASKLNIEIFCPEPDRKYEYVELEKN